MRTPPLADFSNSGILGLPPLTADTLGSGDPRVLGWCREAVQEGDRINRNDPSFDAIERGQQYVGGNHGAHSGADAAAAQKWLPKIRLNQSRKAMQAHVSALTDLKPTFGYQSTNPQFVFQQHLLNKLVMAWWIGSAADLELGEVIKYAFAGGTGDCALEWDPYATAGGDNVLRARDCRDTLPIRPSQHPDLQLWQGLTLREEHTVNVLKNMYPAYAERFRPASDSVLGQVMGRFRQTLHKLITPTADTLSGLSQPTHTQRPKSGQIVLYRTYLADQSRNLTGRPIAMGDPTANWSYVVQPDQPLYPHKRLIVWTEDLILSDGPNPYWHGLYPISRLKLWSLPWLFLGCPILDDLTPVQDAINDTHQDIRLAIAQWLNQGVKFDRSAISEATMRLYDSRKPGAKLKMNQFLEGGLEKMEGPPPQVIQLAIQYAEFLGQRFEDLSGTANLSQLMQLRQLPSGDTIQKYFEALTPEIRYEGRMVEIFLRPLAEMLKVNLFQFMTQSRRMAVLGDAGTALEDFDYDPGTLVPAMKEFKAGAPDPLTGAPTIEKDPQYVPELDAQKPEWERAQFFHKLFTFVVAPNSLLAMNTQEQKMVRLQLFREGVYDMWSLHETLETPNIGTPPPIPLPPLKPVNLQDFIDPMTGMPKPELLGKYTMDPMTGAILEVRIPMTVTERLQAQKLMGIGAAAEQNPAAAPPEGGGGPPGGGPGRPASGQASPKLESKDGGQRQTVTESNK